MMHKLFRVFTLAFWLAVGGFWAAGTWLPEPMQPAAVAGDKVYSLAEVARHTLSTDCWMVIGPDVYDLTAYLPQHPSDPSVVLAWCGKEASEAYRTKTKGRAHSPYADQLLNRYRIGAFAAPR